MSKSSRISRKLFGSAIRLIALTTLTVGLKCGLVGADGEQVQVLRIGTSGDYAPFSFKTAEDAWEGFDIELAKRFAADHGLNVEFVVFRWSDLLNDLEAGKFDVAMSGVTLREDRSLVGRFTVPIAKSGAVVIVRGNETDLTLESINHPGFRIGVNQGGHLERVSRKTFPKATIIASADNQSVPVLLTEDKVDAVVTDSMEAPHWLKRIPNARALPPFTQDLKAWFVHPEKIELAQLLDVWLLAKEADGTLGKIRQAWLPPGTEFKTATPFFALLAAMDERLSLMPMVAGSKRIRNSPVEDPDQEAQVLKSAVAGVMDEAKRQGKSPPPAEAVTRFFRAQIEAAKAIQHQTFEEMPKVSDSPDLVNDLRPALGRISGRINLLLVCSVNVVEPLDSSAIRLQAEEVLGRHGLTSKYLDALVESLNDLNHSANR